MQYFGYYFIYLIDKFLDYIKKERLDCALIKFKILIKKFI